MTVYGGDSEAQGSPRAGVRPLTGGMRWLLRVASVLVFVIGIPLFLLSEQTDRYFAWTISLPLTAAFLGAGYWSSFFIEFVASRERVWANSRVAVPAVFVFTVLTLVATLVHLDLFHLGSRFAVITQVGTWTWMAVYVSVPVLLAVLWAVQNRLPGGDPPGHAPMSGGVRLAIYLLAAGMLVVGVALFVAPLGAGVLWPWELTPLTGRAIGAWLIGLGVAAANMAWERDWRRVLPVSTMFAVFGALELVVLLRFLGDLDWSVARAWFYLLFLLSMLAVGLYGLYAARPSGLRRGMDNTTSDEPRGTSRRIEDLISRMEILLDSMERDADPKRHFLGTYLRTTRAISDELASGKFLDPAWVERWDVFFAGLYLNALEAWNVNGALAEPWRVAFAADTDLPVLRHVLLGMNAHINYDLPLSLLGVMDDAEFADPEVVAKRNRDHLHIDTVLMDRVGAEDEAITAAHGGKSIYERLKAPLERRASGHFLREARAKVWANARLMAAARGRGDAATLQRLRAELARRSAAKLYELARAPEVLLYLWIRGFGVRLDEP